MNLISQVSVAPPWLWLGFSIGVLVLLIVDLCMFGKGSEKVSRKAALLESGLWIAVALVFNLWFASQYGKDLGVEFLTGYLVEKSLSVDNLFIILLIFGSLKIPAQYQHRVLFWGVLGAIVFRAFFIIVGAHLLNLFHWILYVFGGILLITAVKFLFNSDDKSDVKDSWALRVVKRFVPSTDTIKSKAFFVVENGVKKATPLFLALVLIEVTDLVFAVDSIPAVFAVTQDAFVAFASNILAILGLRALYFVLADGVAELRYLKPGLAAVLAFIGAKMLLIDFFKIPSWVSLLVIFSILLTAGLSSWYVSRLEQRRRVRDETI
ncbi:MAG: TerC family protein [Bdellovibrionales bacterium]|nr:TerC family protein [Bdellovibrionales bacterium]